MADPRSEPSMEDILASIKRIIADEPSTAPPPQPAPEQPAAARVSPVMQPRTPPPAAVPSREPPPPWPARREPVPEPQPPESILELTNRMPEPRAPEPPPVHRGTEVPPVQRAVERIRQAEAELPRPAARPVPRDLLPRTPAPRSAGSDVTLDALVREMLEPMLSDWIDRNLPEMVERIVQAEIRRMTERDS